MRQVANSPENTDAGADEPARFEQVERQNFGQQRGDHVEAAAIHVEIDEGESARVAKAGRIERKQQVAVFGMGVIVPAQPVIAERQYGNECDDSQNRDGQRIGGASRRPAAGRQRRRGEVMSVDRAALHARCYLAAYISATWSQLTR